MYFILHRIHGNRWHGCGHISNQHWKQKVVILTTFSSLVVPDVVRKTTSGAASDEEVVNMTTFWFQWIPVCPKSKILCHQTDHPRWMAGWSVLPLGGPHMLWWEMTRKSSYDFCAIFFSTITKAYIIRSRQVSEARDFCLKFSNRFEIWQAALLSKRMGYFSKLHMVVNLRKFRRKFSNHKTDYSVCKYGLPAPFMGHIWRPGDRLCTVLQYSYTLGPKFSPDQGTLMITYKHVKYAY